MPDAYDVEQTYLSNSQYFIYWWIRYIQNPGFGFWKCPVMDPNGLKAMTGYIQNPKPVFWVHPIHQCIKYWLLDKYVCTTSYASGLLKIFKRRDSLYLSSPFIVSRILRPKQCLSHLCTMVQITQWAMIQ